MFSCDGYLTGQLSLLEPDSVSLEKGPGEYALVPGTSAILQWRPIQAYHRCPHTSAGLALRAEFTGLYHMMPSWVGLFLSTT